MNADERYADAHRDVVNMRNQVSGATDGVLTAHIAQAEAMLAAAAALIEIRDELRMRPPMSIISELQELRAVLEKMASKDTERPTRWYTTPSPICRCGHFRVFHENSKVCRVAGGCAIGCLEFYEVTDDPRRET